MLRSFHRRTALSVSALAAAFLAFSAGPPAQERPAAAAGAVEQSAGIPWRTDLAAARREAAEERKPLLIVVRCPP